MLLVAGRGVCLENPQSKGSQNTCSACVGQDMEKPQKASRMYFPLDGAMAGPLAMISLDGPPYPLRSPSEMRSRESTWTGPDAGVSDDKRRANGSKAEPTAANVVDCCAAGQRLLNVLHTRDHVQSTSSIMTCER